MKYVALLRGINVGGNNKVSMKDLKKSFENAGFQSVSTYINSGNVIFEHGETNVELLTARCGELLEKEFGFPIRLSVFDAPSIIDMMDHAPAWWGSDPESKHNAIFVIPPATADEIMAEVGPARPEYEKISAYGNLIFWSAPIKTFSRTRWLKIVGLRAYQDVTIRNANTAKKLLELLRE